MPSRAGLPFLRRLRVFQPDTRDKPSFVSNALRSHTRPVIPLPELTGPDTPKSRVLTQREEDRTPFVREEAACPPASFCKSSI